MSETVHDSDTLPSSDESESVLKRPRRFLTRTHCWVATALTLLTVAAFWQTLGYDFVNWDDPWYVQNNELIKSWSPGNLTGIATETVSRNYAPLTIFSYLVDYTIWGDSPSGFHATNVLLHLFNSMLVFLLLRHLTGSRFIGFATAALFAVHPVQIETVAWISSRKGLLSASFMLSALCVRLRPDPQAKHDAWYLGLLVCALLSKALAVVVPPIVLLYDLLILKRERSQAIVSQVLPGTAALLLLFVTMSSQTTIVGGTRAHLSLGLAEILAVDVTLIWKYFAMLVVPTNLSLLYDPPTSGIMNQVVAGSIGLAILSGFAWWARHRAPLFTLAFATFFLLLLPVLNLFPLTTLMNDRYLYLPCVAFFACVAASVQWCFGRIATTQESKTAADVAWVGTLAGGFRWCLLVPAVSACLVLTWEHLPVWQNSTTLWEHTVAQVPQMPVARIQSALTEYDRGLPYDAILTMRRALSECEPDDADRQRMTSMLDSWVKQHGEPPTGVRRVHRTADRGTDHR